MTFLKVVRPDLGSFHDPTFEYAIGGTKRAPGPRPEWIEPCMFGVLHASISAPQAAVFGRWPYRLLEVDGKPLTEPDGDGKVVFRQITVVRERDVAECFGPNGVAVVALLRQAEQMTADQARQLAAAWHGAWHGAGPAAGPGAGDAARYAAGDAAWYAAWDAARSAARSAAWHAARALVVADLVGQHGLKQHHIDTLLQTWVDVMGDPRKVTA